MGEHKKSAGVFYTDYICYEMDVVKACLSRNGRRLLDAVIADITEGGNLVSSALVKKAGAKLAIPKGYYPPGKWPISIPGDETVRIFIILGFLRIIKSSSALGRRPSSGKLFHPFVLLYLLRSGRVGSEKKVKVPCRPPGVRVRKSGFCSLGSYGSAGAARRIIKSKRRLYFKPGKR